MPRRPWFITPIKRTAAGERACPWRTTPRTSRTLMEKVDKDMGDYRSLARVATFRISSSPR
jgi:hypothetical protein